MRASPLLLALLVPGVVLAQTTGNYITLQYQSRDTVVLTSANCGGTVSVNFTAVSSGSSLCETQMKAWITTGTTCGDAPAAGDLELNSPDISQLRTGTLTFSVSLLPLFGGAGRDGGSSGCTSYAGEANMRLCAAFKYTTNGQCNPASIAKASTPLTVRFDNAPPPAPSIEEVVPLDRSLLVKVVPPDVKDVALIALEYRALDDAGVSDFAGGGSFAVSSTSGKITNLVNGTEYEVRAFAVDEAGNRSVLPSGSATGTPIYTNGFWDRYRDAGGQEQGGCAVGGGDAAGLGLVLLAGLRFVSRRKRS